MDTANEKVVNIFGQRNDRDIPGNVAVLFLELHRNENRHFYCSVIEMRYCCVYVVGAGQKNETKERYW